MFTWTRDLDRTEKKAFWACLGGWALDAMDAQLYALAIPTLLAIWSMTKGEAGLIGTAALVSSAAGGWIAGILCDRIGRVRVLQITIVWFSLFTFLSGLTNDFGQLLAARVLQGFGFGGEWAAGAVLMGEVIQARHRGKAVGLVQSGWSLGYGGAVILYAVIFHFLPKEYAWRALFFVGVIPALLVIFVRRHVEDPKIYLESKAKIAAGKAFSAWEIFSAPLRGRLALGTLLILGVLGGNYTVLTWLPTYLSQTRHLSIAGAGGYLLVNIFGMFCGYMASAFVSDAIGRRKTFMLFAVCASITILVYMFGHLSAAVILPMGWLLGFFQSGILGGTGAFLTELYPTRVRGTAQGFAYNMGRGLGSGFPALVGLFSDSYPLGETIACFAVGAYLIVIIAAFLLPETRGKQLEATA